jgi:SAM-dependent methyltransferase
MEDLWEEAYLRFETPAEERRKFARRLRRIGAGGWDHDARVVELFCGRGNGLHALTELGFNRVEGVDRSARLLAEYRGPARTYLADCRKLPLEDNSRDVVIVQGGLHHLEALPSDLDRTLSEAARVLRPAGLFVAVEPWLTPFLVLTHALCRNSLIRRISGKFDALATMIHHEKSTYEQWLRQPEAILALLNSHFAREKLLVGWGKLMFVGRTPIPDLAPRISE